MKKFVCLVLLVAFIMTSSLAFAYDDAQKWTLGVNVSYVDPEESDADSSCYVGGNIAYDLTRYIAIGGECGYTSWDEDYDGVDYGDVSVVPLLATLIVKNPVELDSSTVVPYGILGIGICFWDYDESSILTDAGISVDMDSEFAVKLGAGIDYYFTENVALNFEGSYMWNDTTGHVDAFGTHAQADIDGDMWMLGGGLKCRF